MQDADKLKQAKEETYVKGFYEGVMEVRGQLCSPPSSRASPSEAEPQHSESRGRAVPDRSPLGRPSAERCRQVGEHKGKKVCDAKPLIKASMIQASQVRLRAALCAALLCALVLLASPQ